MTGDGIQPHLSCRETAVRHQGGWSLRLHCQGLAVHEKLSYPVRYGRYHELLTPDAVYHLGLDGFPKYAQGRRADWPHPQEWLKLTRGGDWIYYSTQGYSDLFDLTGEYYYPFLSYVSNPLFSGNPFQCRAVVDLLQGHDQLCRQAAELVDTGVFTEEAGDVLRLFSHWSSEIISRHGQAHLRLLQTRIPVLPPDCRHVDYDVLPVIISEGCLANCGFCRVKTSGEFRVRPLPEVEKQLLGLQGLLGAELANYRGIFLGQHDTLACGIDHIHAALELVLGRLALGRGFVREPVVFFFASTASLLAAGEAELRRLERNDCRIHINIGLESFDQATLDALQKPVRGEDNIAAFRRILTINRQCSRLALSANLVSGRQTGPGHLDRTIAVITREVPVFDPGTVIYLSPLTGAYVVREVRADLRRIQALRRLPVYPYLIQRLF